MTQNNSTVTAFDLRQTRTIHNGAVMMNGRRYIGDDACSVAHLQLGDGKEFEIQLDPFNHDKAFVINSTRGVLAVLRAEPEINTSAASPEHITEERTAATLMFTEEQLNRMFLAMPFEDKIIAVQAYLNTGE